MEVNNEDVNPFNTLHHSLLSNATATSFENIISTYAAKTDDVEKSGARRLTKVDLLGFFVVYGGL